MPVQLFSKLCSCATPAKTHSLTLEQHPGLTHQYDQWAIIYRFQSVIFFSFDFDLLAVIVISMPHFTNIVSLTAEIWHLSDFQDGPLTAWLWGRSPRSAPSCQISPLWLKKCGPTAPKSPKLVFLYNLPKRGVPPYAIFLYKIWLREGSPRSAPSCQISSLWL